MIIIILAIPEKCYPSFLKCWGAVCTSGKNKNNSNKYNSTTTNNDDDSSSSFCNPALQCYFVCNSFTPPDLNKVPELKFFNLPGVLGA